MKNLSAVYFSPTGGTRKAVLNLAAGMGGDIEEVDLCALKGERGFGPEDLVIVGMPVFGGRIPGFAAKLLKQCRGNGATAVTVAVYGNRAFEDALVELNDALKELGFKIGASAALLAEHSMAREVAAGRPDKKDEEDARGFAGKILEKLAGDGWQEPKVPGDRPYRSWKQMPVVPLADDTCITWWPLWRSNVRPGPYPRMRRAPRIRGPVCCACGALPSVRYTPGRCPPRPRPCWNRNWRR